MSGAVVGDGDDGVRIIEFMDGDLDDLDAVRCEALSVPCINRPAQPPSSSSTSSARRSARSMSLLAAPSGGSTWELARESVARDLGLTGRDETLVTMGVQWTVDVGRNAEVSGHDGEVVLRPRERSIVAALALVHPKRASVIEIASLVWGHDMPATAKKAVHNHILRVRRVAPGLILTSPDGYHFAAAVDVRLAAVEDAFAELADVAQVSLARARSRERRLVDDELDAGRRVVEHPSDETCAYLASLVEHEPQRAVRWWWLVVLTARLGRRRDALDLLRRARSSVDLDAGGRIVQHFDELEQIVLHDDPVLDADALVTPPFDDPDSARERIGYVDPDGEHRRLHRLLAQSEVTSVAVIAPSGSGKTAICRAVSDSLTSAGWVVAWCSIAHGPDPTDAFRQLLERLRPSPTATGEVDALNIVEHVEVLLRTPSPRPRCIVIDDIHFLVGDRLDWVRRIIEAASESGAAVLITSRDGDMQELSAVDHRVRLQPWNRSTVEAYLHHFVPASRWAHEAATWIHARSGGNALFVRELTLDVVYDLPIGVAETAFVPPDRTNSASTAAALRLAHLHESTRRVLAGAAVWGRTFRNDELTGTATSIELALAEAQAADVVERRPDGTSRFRHDAYRDALLTDVDDEILVATGHLRAERSDAIAVAMTSADTAVAEGRPNDAIRLARRAADLAEELNGRDPTWVEAMVKLGSASLSVGTDDAVDVLIGATHRAFDLELERLAGEALRHLGRIGPSNVVGGVDTRLEALVERALATFTDPAARAMVGVAATSLYGFGTDAVRTRRLYDEALASARASADPDVVAMVLRSAYLAVMRPPDVDVRRSIADELDELAVRLARADLRYEACRLRISVLTETGDGDPRPCFEEVERLAGRFNERSRNWGLFSFAAMIQFLDGDFDRAEHTVMRLAGPDVVASASLVVATMGAHLLGLRLATDRVAELAPMVDDLVERQPALAAWRAVRTLTLAYTDREAEARRSFDSVIPPPADTASVAVAHLPDDFTRTAAIAAMARAAMRLDDRERMLRIVPLLEPASTRWIWHGTGTIGPVDLELAMLHRALGNNAWAADHAAGALASAIRVGAPMIAADAAGVFDDAATTHGTATR
jgi:hypothetical protein